MEPINRIRRTAWTLVAICLASSLAAQSYNPHILKSQVVSLDAKAIEADANSKTPFELILGETRVTVILAPAPIWPKEGLTVLEVGRDGATKQTTIQGNITYAGDVMGDDPAQSEVRLTIAHGVLEGYVLTSTDWWFIEPLARFDPKAGPDQYLVYAARDVDYAIDYGDDGVKTDRVYDPPVFSDPRIHVAMISDGEYVDQSGPGFEWIERQAALLNDVSGIFKDQFGRELITRNGIADVENFSLTSTDPATLLQQLDDLVHLNSGGVYFELHSQLAHLTTGKNMNGSVVGRAHRPGYTAFSQQSVSGAYRNMILMAHEIGNNFNAVDSEADRWCAFKWNNVCFFYQQTLDWPVFRSGTIPRFSDGTRNSNHNNAQRICDELAFRHFPCLP